MRTQIGAVVVLLLALSPLVSTRSTQALRRIRVAASPAVRGAIVEIAPAFESDSGVRVDAEYDVFAVIKRRIDSGQSFDVVVLSPELVRDLVAANKLLPETVSLGRQGIGLAALAGQPAPDIRTPTTLEQTLLAAQSIGYFREGTAGAHFLTVVERLGMSARLSTVLRGYDGQDIERAISQGAVQYATAGTATLRAMPGLGEVVALPAEFQSYTDYAAGVHVSAENVDIAQAFLRFLGTSAARRAFVASGLEPSTR